MTTTTTTKGTAVSTSKDSAIKAAQSKVATQLRKIAGYEFNANTSRLAIVQIVEGIAPHFATKAGKIQPTPAVRAVMPEGTSAGVISQFVKAFTAVQDVRNSEQFAELAEEEARTRMIEAVAAVWAGDSARVKSAKTETAKNESTGEDSEGEDVTPPAAPEVDLFADTLAAAKQLAACLKALDSVTVEQEQQLQAALTLVTKNLKTVKRVK
jgi:hypothetical protein